MASNSSRYPNPESPNKVINTNVAIFIVTFVVSVVVLLIVIHLYVRLTLHRAPSGGPGRHFAESPTPPPPVSRAFGLDSATMAALPTFFVQGDSAAAAECAVCLSAMVEGERAKLLPNCKHVFHVVCIDMWLFSHSTCPLCRRDADPAVAAVEAPEGRGCHLEEGGSTSRSSSSSPPPPPPPSFRMEDSREWSGRIRRMESVEDLERHRSNYIFQ
ncbi:RING-H2 finger protein ATL40-like [Canna indica]|uniref:RING-H2 finger protein ATL40-like n=1 Tax=Canna indica TaxID=4628 RepID=A0AAQ3QDW3_9LILI|nr:RING-H2 finger protein ATL40-like [Canna indica]